MPILRDLVRWAQSEPRVVPFLVYGVALLVRFVVVYMMERNRLAVLQEEYSRFGVEWGFLASALGVAIMLDKQSRFYGALREAKADDTLGVVFGVVGLGLGYLIAYGMYRKARRAVLGQAFRLWLGWGNSALLTGSHVIGGLLLYCVWGLR